MRWGTITATSPLRIRLDGDTDPLPLTPDSLVDPLLLDVGDRVRCEVGGRVVIVGKSGGAPFPPFPFASIPDTLAGTADDLAVTPEGLATFAGRPMIPSSVVVGSGSGSFATDGTVTFTGASSVSLNGVFNGSGMDEYRVVWRLITSNAAAIAARLRTSGGVDSITEYDNQRLTAIGTTTTPIQSLNITEIVLSGGIGGADARHYGSLELTAPTSASLPTLFRVSNVATPAAMTSAYGTYYGGGQRRAGSSYTGITLFVPGGTITGVARVVKLG